MKNQLTKKAVFIAILLIGSIALSQPYTLDKNVKPEKLNLLDDPDNEGAKGIIKNATVDGEDQFYYIKGHDLYQFIDVYVMANYGDPSLKADLAYINWTDVEDSQITTQEKDGIINFKVRALDAFGLRIYAGSEPINYTIAVYASPQKKEFLGTPFRKATANDLKSGESNLAIEGDNTNNSGNSGSSNTLLYIGFGIALLVIGFLVAKLMAKNKNTAIILLFIMSGIFNAQAQQHAGNTWGPSAMKGGMNGSYGQWLRGNAEQNRNGLPYDVAKLQKGLKRFDQLGKKVGKALGTYKKASDLYDKYTGLGNCMSYGPPPGMPSIPSFCETNDCEECFGDARARLEENRYTFEQLRTIYKCTKNFTKSAIAFGDNVSGYHGISGLAWQKERVGIEKSVKGLEKAYDAKFIELLERQKVILLELNECEAQHGIPDWYDRFGYLFYEFTKMNYRRAN